MALSPYLASALYRHVLTNTPYTPPATVYLALYTDATTECTASGYARQPVTFGPDQDGHGKSSNAPSVGPLAGSGRITHAALYDDGGNALTAITELAEPKAWGPNDTIVFTDIDFGIA